MQKSAPSGLKTSTYNLEWENSRRKRRVEFHDILPGNNSLFPTSTGNKSKNGHGQTGLHQIKEPVLGQGNQGQSMQGIKTPAGHTRDKGLTSETQKEFKPLNSKETTNLTLCTVNRFMLTHATHGKMATTKTYERVSAGKDRLCTLSCKNNLETSQNVKNKATVTQSSSLMFQKDTVPTLPCSTAAWRQEINSVPINESMWCMSRRE